MSQALINSYLAIQNQLQEHPSETLIEALYILAMTAEKYHQLYGKIDPEWFSEIIQKGEIDQHDTETIKLMQHTIQRIESTLAYIIQPSAHKH